MGARQGGNPERTTQACTTGPPLCLQLLPCWQMHPRPPMPLCTHQVVPVLAPHRVRVVNNHRDGLTLCQALHSNAPGRRSKNELPPQQWRRRQQQRRRQRRQRRQRQRRQRQRRQRRQPDHQQQTPTQELACMSRFCWSTSMSSTRSAPCTTGVGREGERGGKQQRQGRSFIRALR